MKMEIVLSKDSIFPHDGDYIAHISLCIDGVEVLSESLDEESGKFKLIKEFAIINNCWVEEEVF